MKEKIDVKKVVNYWNEGAERDFVVAKSLLKLKHYSHCLFFCHLGLEKLLKGLVVAETKIHAPYIHHLEKLAKLIKLKLTEEQMENLKIITDFNIAGRYDDVKYKFYKQCTKLYTEKYFKICEELYLWLKKQYPKK
ncbi:MAG: HEPN domain-containing protein [bacterium]